MASYVREPMNPVWTETAVSMRPNGHLAYFMPFQPLKPTVSMRRLRSDAYLLPAFASGSQLTDSFRPLPSNLTTEIQTKTKKTLANPRGSLAGMPGLEPRMAEPESAVLPITPHPNLAWRSNSKELFVVPPTGFEPVLAP